MESRSTTELVEFHHSFLISARPSPLPAGCYRVHIEEEMLDGLSFPVWRRTSMTITQHGPSSGRLLQAYSITPIELATVRAADGAARP